jgi:hypothetical protein
MCAAPNADSGHALVFAAKTSQSGSDRLLKPLEPSSIENLTKVENNIIQSLFVRSDFPPELQESEDGDDGVELEFRATDEL